MNNRRGKGKRSRSRGAALIEAALVAPVFFLTIFAIIEFGFLFRNYLTIGAVTSETARTAAIRGNDPDADFQVLSTFEQAFAAWDIDDLQVLVIYKATDPNDPVPPACLAGSNIASFCNTYTKADLLLPMEDGTDLNFGDCNVVANGSPTGSVTGDSIDKYWCPTSRDANLTGGVDMIGIHVVATHSYLTGFFGEDATLSYTQVVRIEPERAQ